MAKGWIKLHRSLINHDLWTSEPFTKGQAWIDLLLLANGTNNGEHKTGSVYRGKQWLADRWKWSRGKVSRFINELEEQGMITQNGTQGGTHNGTVITIVKWGFFQNDRTQNGTQNGQKIEHYKEEKKKEKKSDLPTASEVLYGGCK